VHEGVAYSNRSLIYAAPVFDASYSTRHEGERALSRIVQHRAPTRLARTIDNVHIWYVFGGQQQLQAATLFSNYIVRQVMGYM